MRCLLVVDDNPHIGGVNRVWPRHRRFRASAADGGPTCPASLGAVLDVSADLKKDLLQAVKPPRTITVSRRRWDHRLCEEVALSSGGAASVNQGRLPGVAGRQYTPQLE
jgi:hypothetical protein